MCQRGQREGEEEDGVARRRPRPGRSWAVREMGQRGEAWPCRKRATWDGNGPRAGKKKNGPRGLGLRWRREKERGEGGPVGEEGERSGNGSASRWARMGKRSAFPFSHFQSKFQT